MIRRRSGGGALALVIVFAGMLASCGISAGDKGTSGTDQPRVGGELTFATDADPGCIDPHQSPTAASQLVSRGVVDSLVAQDPQGMEITPWLAESWEASPDATGFTFRLRDGVSFSDGVALTAAAVKANFDRIVDATTKSLLAARLLAGYIGTTVVDDHTVTVRFRQPNSSFLQAASTAFLGMESPASFAAGPQALCRRPIGSGPFVVADYQRQQSITLTRRAEYKWGASGAEHRGAAHLDRITINIVPENGVRLGSLRSRQVDAAANIPPRDADGLGESGFQVLSKEQPGIAYVLLLNADRAPWTDVVLRRAIAKAVNPDQIVSTLYQGKYPRATSVLTTTTPGHATILATSQFDGAEANRLLDQAGWRKDNDGTRSKDGRLLSIEWIYVSPAREQRDLLAQLVQQQLKEVGITVILTPLPLGAVIGRLTRGDWGLNDISLVRADGAILRTVFTKPGGDPSVAAAAEVVGPLSAADATVDPLRRAMCYEQAQRLIIDRVLAIPVYNPTYLLGADNAVHGLEFDPQGLPSFYNAWVAR